MLVKNGDGTFTGGHLDVWCILHDENTGRYHAAFFEEKPMPGPQPELKDIKIVRLKSKMHHTEGAEDLDGANKHLDEFAAKIKVPDENIQRDPIPWDGIIGIVRVVENWRLEPESTRI
jgi:hypothetical protein